MLKNPFKKNSIANEYQTLVSEINSLESKFQTLTDSEIRLKTNQLRKQYQADPNLTNITPEAFALTREASVRTLGLRHDDVQLIGGLVLNSGKIAEMRTGEGKTLVATLPAYLNAVTKKGVHIVTVNDYLASRDQLSMGQVYRFLGLNTGLIQDDMSTLERKKNYNADVTYVTNSKFCIFNPLSRGGNTIPCLKPWTDAFNLIFFMNKEFFLLLLIKFLDNFNLGYIMVNQSE